MRALGAVLVYVVQLQKFPKKDAVIGVLFFGNGQGTRWVIGIDAPVRLPLCYQPYKIEGSGGIYGEERFDWKEGCDSR